MSKRDVLNRADIEDIVSRFYQTMLKDPIIGFIFTDIAKINLEHHLPIITDFWADSLFKGSSYKGNALRKHLQLNEIVALKPGHFTRWLYLFNGAVDAEHQGDNADRMKGRAEMVAKAISAAVTDNKKSDMNLVLRSEKTD